MLGSPSPDFLFLLFVIFSVSIEEEIKTEIDADSPSFIEKQTKWINGQYNYRHYYYSTSFAKHVI